MFDLIILGSGPAGVTAAIYASRAGLYHTVIEKEYMGTGQIAFTERVDNYPGLYGTDGFSLGEKFREHAGALGTEFTEGEVTGLEKSGDIWKVTLSDGTVLESKAVIYAAGASPLEALCKRSGISPAIIYNMRNGFLPSIDKITAIAEYCGVSVDNLIGFQAKKNWAPMEPNSREG